MPVQDPSSSPSAAPGGGGARPKRTSSAPIRPADYAHSPAHHCVALRDAAGLQAILAGLPPLAHPSRVLTAADAAREARLASSVAAALDRRDVPGGDTALHLAVRLRLPSMASALAAAGADPTLQNHAGWTPLQEALCLGCRDQRGRPRTAPGLAARAPPRPPRGGRCVLPWPRQRATGEPPHPTRPPTGRADVVLIQHGYVAATAWDTTSAFSRHPRRRRPRHRRAGVARRVHPTKPPNPPHRARMPRHSHHEPPPARLLLRMRLRGAVLLPYIRLGPAQLHRVRPPPPQLPGARPASATATDPRPSRRRHTAAASSRHTPRHEPLSVSVSLPLPASIPVPVSAA